MFVCSVFPAEFVIGQLSL
nr:TPA_asm: m170l iORF 3 RNA 1 [Murid betaherpesvirus 1]DBA08151.1 TPA_asm: m170l iORF 3 RNA 1 [Murid betaherpesvirus 1]